MILVDTNVLIDILTHDPVWGITSLRKVGECVLTEELAINPIIYAELAFDFKNTHELDRALYPLDLTRLPIPYEAAFLTGKIFLDYRKKGGSKSAPLPDFYIGAHAQIEKHKILTRDVKKYKTYFPKVALIHP